MQRMMNWRQGFTQKLMQGGSEYGSRFDEGAPGDPGIGAAHDMILPCILDV